MSKERGIAVAGNLIMDYYKAVELYPEHSNLTTITSIKPAIGGAVCNSGMDLCIIDPDMTVYAIGVVGDDQAGHDIVAGMRAFPNLNCERVTYDTTTSFTDVMEDRTNHTRTFFHYRGANAKLEDRHFDFSDFRPDILHIGYILLLDGMDAEDAEYGTVMARVLARAQAAGIKTSIDVVSEASERFAIKVPPALKYSDYCIINEVEAGKSCGISVRDAEGRLQLAQLRKVCERLLELGVSTWAIVHAREGGVGLSAEGEFVTSPALDMRGHTIQGTTGAGDAFLAGTLYGAWKGYSLRSSIELGIATAAASLTDASSTGGVKSEAELRAFHASCAKENWPDFDD